MQTSALILAALLACAAAVSHTIRIGSAPSVKQRYLREGKLPEYLARKEARLAKSAQIAKSSNLAAASDPIIDFDDMAYFAFIDLGTPRQNFLVFIDSGSSTLWVPDLQCGGGGTPTCGLYCSQTTRAACLNFCRPECCNGQSFEQLGAANACLSKRHFNSTGSTTFVKNGAQFDLTYQTGEVKGYIGQDTFCLSNTSFCVQNQAFGLATTLGSDFGSQPMDGILGLGWPALAFNKINPPFFNAWSQGVMNQPIYTVYLQTAGSQVSTSGGQLTVGDYDTVNCAANIDWVTLTSTTFWQFKLDSVSAGSYSAAPASGWQAYSNTASTYMGGPSAVVQKLAAQVGATFNAQYNGYFIDCDSEAADIDFIINGKKYALTSKNYVIAVGPGMCQFAFFPMNGGGFFPAWMIGPPMIREFCQVHNIQTGQLGFAKVTAH